MSKINQPYDFLELPEHQRLRTILQDNFALKHNEYRPLQEFDGAMRMFARDFLRNYLSKEKDITCSDRDIEGIISNFEQELYGTAQQPTE